MGIFSNVSPQERAVNDQIQQTHNQINELYTDIGRYVKLNLKDKLDDQYVQSHCQSIDDCLARLQQLNNDLNAIKGLKTCTNCHAQIPIGVTFCPACGTKQPDLPMNNMGMNQMNGGFAQPVPMAYPQHQNAVFNPTSAGNSPSNPNRNMAPGANGGFVQPQPQPQMAAVPPVPPVPPVPQAAPQQAPMPQNDPLANIPPVPPVPQKKDAEPLQTNVITNDKPAAAVIPEDKPTDPVTQSPVQEAAPAPEAAPAAQAPTEFIFCSQCGHKEQADVTFCSQCGSKL